MKKKAASRHRAVRRNPNRLGWLLHLFIPYSLSDVSLVLLRAKVGTVIAANTEDAKARTC